METCNYEPKKGILTLPRRFIDDLFHGSTNALVVNDPTGWFISVYPVHERPDLRRMTWSRALAFAYGIEIDSNETDRAGSILLDRISYRYEFGGLGEEDKLYIPTDPQAGVNINNVNIRGCAQVVSVLTLDHGDLWVPTKYQAYYSRVKARYEKPLAQEIGFRAGEAKNGDTTTPPVPPIATPS